MMSDYAKLLRECKVRWSIGVQCWNGDVAIVLMLVHKPTGLWVRQSFKTHWSIWPFAIGHEIDGCEKPAWVIKCHCRKLRAKALEYLSLAIDYGIRDNLTTKDPDSFEHNYSRWG